MSGLVTQEAGPAGAIAPWLYCQGCGVEPCVADLCSQCDSIWVHGILFAEQYGVVAPLHVSGDYEPWLRSATNFPALCLVLGIAAPWAAPETQPLDEFLLGEGLKEGLDRIGARMAADCICTPSEADR